MESQDFRYQFRAVANVQVSARRYRLLDVYCLDLDRPFRNHLWIDWTVNNPFRVPLTIYFEATVHLYQKRSGNYRFGLKDPKLIKLERSES